MSDEIRFAIFCLENYKRHRHLSGRAVDQLFRDYDVYGYLKEFYDPLHTTGIAYINRDIDEFLEARGYHA